MRQVVKGGSGGGTRKSRKGREAKRPLRTILGDLWMPLTRCRPEAFQGAMRIFRQALDLQRSREGNSGHETSCTEESAAAGKLVWCRTEGERRGVDGTSAGQRHETAGHTASRDEQGGVAGEAPARMGGGARSSCQGKAFPSIHSVEHSI